MYALSSSQEGDNFTATTVATSPSFCHSCQEKQFEEKFMSIIDSLGTFKIKSAISPLMYTYFKIKLNCRTNRYTYETIVIGDESDDEAEARESAFYKAYHLLRKVFMKELQNMERVKRKRDQSVS